MSLHEEFPIQTQKNPIDNTKANILVNKSSVNNKADTRHGEKKEQVLEFLRQKLSDDDDYFMNMDEFGMFEPAIQDHFHFIRSVEEALREFEQADETDLGKYITDHIESESNLFYPVLKEHEPEENKHKLYLEYGIYHGKYLNAYEPRDLSNARVRFKKEMCKLENIKEYVEFYKPQSWIDKSREESQDYLNSYFKKIGDITKRKIILEFFSPVIKSNSNKTFSVEEMDDMQIETIYCKSASWISGREVSRTIVMFTERKAFYKFLKGLYGSSFVPLGGLYHIRGDFKGTIFENTGIIIALQSDSPFEGAIGHEIRHSIDPNIGNRDGYDQIIEEVFAYYYQDIIEYQDMGSNKWDTERNKWDSLRKSIRQKMYYENQSRRAKNKISKKKFNNLCRLVVDGIKEYRRNHSDIETQRMIVQCLTLNDFFDKVGYKYPNFI